MKNIWLFVVDSMYKYWMSNYTAWYVSISLYAWVNLRWLYCIVLLLVNRRTLSVILSRWHWVLRQWFLWLIRHQPLV